MGWHQSSNSKPVVYSREVKSPKIILVAHNIRSCHNVGSLMRTAEGLGLEKLYLSGYSPYPAMNGDGRLPHITAKLSRQIHKTALGAEESLNWQHEGEAMSLIERLRSDGYKIVALEQSASSIDLADYKPSQNLALIVGGEVKGLDSKILKICDEIIEIPMYGQKESFNVSVAAGIALYHLKSTLVK